ncbi:hypothetical protein [Nocardia sp. X0981]
MRDIDINLVRTELPNPGHDGRVITLPIALWLSAGFWDLFGLPDRERVLATLAFGTEDSPRTYIAGHPRDPAEWDSTALTVDLPPASGAGPGVLHVGGPMTEELRRTVERTGLVIMFTTPSEYEMSGTPSERIWDPHRCHTAVLVPRGKPGRAPRCATRGNRAAGAWKTGHLS